MISASNTRGWIAAALALVALLYGAPLWAQGKDAALDRVREANGHYDAGEFDDALLKYRQAYDVLEDVRLLYRIGLSYENLGNYARARQMLLRYLELDEESPVEGRVRAKIDQLRDLETNIQAYLAIETVPSGATVYLNGYMGQAEGTAPLTMPVGAGENVVTLVFPDRQRLQVVVDVGAGQRVERLFQVGPGAAIGEAGPETGEDTAGSAGEALASVEGVAPESLDSELVGTEETPAASVEDSEEASPEEGVEAKQAADVIPMPGSEPQMDRPVQLDRVSIAPPWWANTLAVVSFVGSAACAAGMFTERVPAGPGALCMVALTGGGFYLLGRDWKTRLPPASMAPGYDVQAGARQDRVLGVSFGGRF
ncbi:PEGA domain-containing protein [Lujinxingia litoralis]|nr:PEGA domain-containing protein [Lujinxingia litoralis]